MYFTYANYMYIFPLIFIGLSSTLHSDMLEVPPGALSVSKLSSVVTGHIF